MKNTFFYRKISFWLLFSYTSSMSAQQTVSLVTDFKTDRRFANTTEIYKAEKASDTDVLTEIEANYGLGDVVRITVAPPKPKPEPVKVAVTTNNAINTPKTNLATVANSTPRTQPTTRQTKPVQVEYRIIESKTTLPSAATTKTNSIPVSTTKTVSAPIASKTTTIPVAATMPSIPVASKTNTTAEEKQPQDLGTESSNNAGKLVAVNSNENLTNTSIENNETRVSNRATKSSNSVKSVKSSKSNRKKSFSLFENISFKSAKKSKPSGGKKYGCYRF